MTTANTCSPWLIFSTLCGVLLATSAAGATAPAPSSPIVAVFRTSADRLTDEDLDRTEGLLRAAVKAAGLRVEPAEVTAQALKEARNAGVDCAVAEADCASRIALFTQADRVAHLDIRAVPGGYRVRGQFIDVAKAQSPRVIVARVGTLAPTPGGDLAALLKRLVSGEGPPFPAPVVVRVDPEVASVGVDGSPSPPGTLWLLPGPHQLHVAAPGYSPRDLEIVVREDGESSDVVIALALLPKEGMPVTLVSGIGLVSVGSLLVLGGAALAFYEDTVLSATMPYYERQQNVAIGLSGLAGAVIGGGMIVGGVLLIAQQPADGARTPATQP